MPEDERSANGSDSGLSVMYRCRHCPGAEFTAAERDVHRSTHQKKRQRGGSPPLTLFEPITVVDDGSSNASNEGAFTTKKRKRGSQVARRGGGHGHVEWTAAGPGAATCRSRPQPDKRTSIKHYSHNKQPRVHSG